MQYLSRPGRMPQTLRQLFLSTFYISAFTFGGGFVIVTFMKQKFVDKLRWIDEKEMLDLIALSQSAPGPIAVNASILTGWRVAGFAGMVTAVLGTVLPPLIILSVISLCYEAFAQNLYVALTLKGMQAGVAAVILDVICRLGKNVIKEKSLFSLCIMAFAFIAVYFFKVNVIYIVSAAVFAGVCKTFLQIKGGRAA